MRKKKKCSYNGSMDCGKKTCPLDDERFYHKVGMWLSCEPYQYSVDENELIELADMYLCLYDVEDILRTFYTTNKVDRHVCSGAQKCYSRYVRRFLKSGDYGKSN